MMRLVSIATEEARGSHLYMSVEALILQPCKIKMESSNQHESDHMIKMNSEQQNVLSVASQLTSA